MAEDVDVVRTLRLFMLGWFLRGVAEPPDGGTGDAFLTSGVDEPARRLWLDVILLGVRPEARDGVLREGDEC